MKKINSNWLIVSLAFAIAFFSACSKDDTDGLITPEFPEKKTINVTANSETEIKFNANQSWKLTSSQIWATFIDGEVKDLSDISGKAGSQSVKMRISDSGSSTLDIKAEITLEMGGQKQVIAEIVRSGSGFKLVVKDQDGNELDAIKVGFSNYEEFYVQANFDFAITDKPDWLGFEGTINISGDANENVKGAAIILQNEKIEKYPNQESTVTFSNQEGTASFVIPLSYAGMDSDVLYISENSPWDWNVSLDGKSFTQTSGLDNQATIELENNIPFTITTLKDEYKFLYAEVSGGEYWTTDESGEPVSWLKVVDVDGKGKVKVEVDELEVNQPWDLQERKGTIFAIPAAIYETVKEELVDGTPTSTEDMDEEEVENSFANKYDKYILAEVNQKEQNNAGSIIVLQSGFQNIETSVEDNEEIVNYLTNEVGVNEVLKVSVLTEMYHTLNPQLSNFGEDSFYALTLDFKKIDAEDSGLSIGSTADNGFIYVELNTSASLKPFIVIFEDGDRISSKALVVYPSED